MRGRCGLTIASCINTLEADRGTFFEVGSIVSDKCCSYGLAVDAVVEHSFLDFLAL